MDMNNGHTPDEELDAVVSRLVASYADKEIDSLESAALPNRRTVIEALNHLKPVIYMGFYSTRPLRRGNLGYAGSRTGRVRAAHRTPVWRGSAARTASRSGRR